ncbi:MAG: sulfotransferase family 2 domain-containing protein [Roseovarius sp.]
MHLFDHKLSYFPVPKCGSTSVIAFLFEVQNGFAFRPYVVDGRKIGLHEVVKMRAFEKHPLDKVANFRKIAVVRDPAERMVSFFYDKFIPKKAGRKSEIEARGVSDALMRAGLNPQPEVEEFVEKVEAYRDAHPFMKLHLLPLTHFLGEDADYYDRIFDIRELDELEDYVVELTGTSARMGHIRKTPRADKADTVAHDAARKARKVFAEEYDIFGDCFTTHRSLPPSRMEDARKGKARHGKGKVRPFETAREHRHDWSR